MRRLERLRRQSRSEFLGRAKPSCKDIPSLNWALSTSTIVGLDIATAFEANAQTVAINGMEGLLAVSDQLTLTPLLATSWKYDEPNLRYVFQIRPGVKFWDGTAMTMDDVVYSLTRHIDPKVGSQISGYFANVDSFVQTGASELTIKLKKPDPLVANALVFAPILAKAFAQKLGKGLGSPGSGLRIMGTGPYQLTSFPNSTSATIDRFDGYWGAKPRVKTCSFSCISDTQTLQLAAQSGQSSGTFSVPVQDAAAWKQISTVGPTLPPAWPSRPCRSTPAFRRSTTCTSVRRSRMRATCPVTSARSWTATAPPAQGVIVPPQQWGSVLPQAQVAKLYQQLPTYPFSLANAKKELAQSAHPHGFTTNNVLVPNNSPAVVKMLESLSTTVKQLGINMPIQQVPTNDWLANLYAHKNLGLICLLFVPDYADPADYMNLIYPSANAVKNNFNLANFKNSEVDKLAAAGQFGRVECAASAGPGASTDDLAAAAAVLLPDLAERHHGYPGFVQLPGLHRPVLQPALAHPHLLGELTTVADPAAWTGAAEQRAPFRVAEWTDGAFAVRSLSLAPPGPGEAQVRVAACSVCLTEVHFTDGYYDELDAPARLGHEYCGVVTAVGPGVTSPALGSLVAGFDTFGGFGEVVTAAAGLFVLLPDGLPADRGCLLEPVTAAPMRSAGARSPRAQPCWLPALAAMAC